MTVAESSVNHGGWISTTLTTFIFQQLAPHQLPGALRRRCESTTLTTFIVNNTLRAKQHIARFEEVILTTDGTDGHGNAGDVANDNGDNIAPKSISLGRSRKIIKILLAALEKSKKSYIQGATQVITTTPSSKWACKMKLAHEFGLPPFLLSPKIKNFRGPQ